MNARSILVKILLIMLLCHFGLVNAAMNDHFVTTWKTDNPGVSNDTSITIPTNGLYTYNYQVDWNGDGDFDDADESTFYTGDATHDYFSIGTYQIRIQGDFPAIAFTFGTDADKILSVDQWGTGNWLSMNNAFRSCDNLVVNATDAPDLSMATRMDGMFNGAINVGNGTGNWVWDTSTITNMSSLFINAANFNKDISNWDTAEVLLMDDMFAGASIFNQNISNWNTSKVTDMDGMFRSAKDFNQPIGTWDTTQVQSFRSMFFSARAFNQDLSNWVTSNVTNMRSMFLQATNFDGDISTWDTSMVTNMSTMFTTASNFNQDITNWITNNVTNMSNMFRNAVLFNQDIGGWNTSLVNNMSQMFYSADAFNQNIGNWNTAMVTDMSQMFYSADAFNQNIGNWNTAMVDNMSSMFAFASDFDQNLGEWNVENVDGFTDMFIQATLSTDNYDALLTGWNAQNLQSSVSFHAGNSKYCSQAAQIAHQNMINTDNWNIIDGGLANSCLQIIDLDVSIVDNTETINNGDNVTYSITVRNIANGDALDSSVIDLIPTEIISTSWDCVPAAGASCTASGNGSINDLVDIPSGSRVTYTVNAIITNGNFSQVQYSVDAQSSLLQTDIDISNNVATDTNINADIIFMNGFD